MLRTSLNAFDKFLELDTFRIDAQANEATSLHMRDSFDKLNIYVDDLKNIFEGLTNLKSEIDTFESAVSNPLTTLLVTIQMLTLVSSIATQSYGGRQRQGNQVTALKCHNCEFQYPSCFRRRLSRDMDHC